MDPELTLFAETAGTTVVALMATDAWQRTKNGVVALWRRVKPADAAAADSRLEATRSQILLAREQGDTDAERALGRQWQELLQPLLTADPDISAALRQALREAAAVLPDSERSLISTVRLTAEAKGHSRIYQAGRDQHITER